MDLSFGCNMDSAQKWVVSFIVALLFLVFASPIVFKLVNSITSKFNVDVASATGCPTILGLFVHALVFLLVFRLLLAFQ